MQQVRRWQNDLSCPQRVTNEEVDHWAERLIESSTKPGKPLKGILGENDLDV